jgi:hypothetical protein
MNMEKLTPATAAAASERKRVPMSTPVLRLETPEIPGYHCHWFRGTPERLARAQQGGYEFVHDDELKLNNRNLGSGASVSGNTDLGSHVSVGASDQIGPDGQPTKMILMKIKKEWFDEDQEKLVDRSEQVAASLRGGLIGSEKDGSGDTKQRYVDKKRTEIPAFFTRKRPKAA